MINLYAQELMAALLKQQVIKMKDMYQSGLEKSVIDFLIAEMVQAKYITLDFDDNGDEIVKEYKGDKKPIYSVKNLMQYLLIQQILKF